MAAPTRPALRVAPAAHAHEREVDRRLGHPSTGSMLPTGSTLALPLAERLRRAAAGPGRPPTSSEQLNLYRQTGLRSNDATLHEGPEPSALADALSAEAFTVGADVFLGRDAPDHPVVVAHELAHVALGHGHDTTLVHRAPKGFQKSSKRYRATEASSLRARIYFATDQASLTADDSKVIEAMAAKHRSQAATSIRFGIEGFADERGGVVRNLELSEKRGRRVAAAVEGAYGRAGIAVETIVYPRGEDESPTTSDENELAEYRRADIRVEASSRAAASSASADTSSGKPREPVERREPEPPPAKSTVKNVGGAALQATGVAAGVAGATSAATTLTGAAGTAAGLLGAAAPFLQGLAFALIIESRGDDIEQAVESRGYAYGVVAAAAGVEVGEPSQGGPATRTAFRRGVRMGRQAFHDANMMAGETVGSSSRSLESWLNVIHDQVVDAWFSEDFLWTIPATSPAGVNESSCRLRWPGPSWSATGGVCVEP